MIIILKAKAARRRKEIVKTGTDRLLIPAIMYQSANYLNLGFRLLFGFPMVFLNALGNDLLLNTLLILLQGN